MKDTESRNYVKELFKKRLNIELIDLKESKIEGSKTPDFKFSKAKKDFFCELKTLFEEITEKNNWAKKENWWSFRGKTQPANKIANVVKNASKQLKCCNGLKICIILNKSFADQTDLLNNHKIELENVIIDLIIFVDYSYIDEAKIFFYYPHKNSGIKKYFT